MSFLYGNNTISQGVHPSVGTSLREERVANNAIN